VLVESRSHTRRKDAIGPAINHASGAPAVNARAWRSHDAASSGQLTTAVISPPRSVQASTNAAASALDPGSRAWPTPTRAASMAATKVSTRQARYRSGRQTEQGR
jgi:hypothetical protein